MGLQGYVGSAADQARIRQLEQAREEETQRLEEAKKAAAEQPQGFRQWEHGTTEVLETAFKKETVGLVSRDEYVEKKSSIQARLEVGAACSCPPPTGHMIQCHACTCTAGSFDASSVR